jgi:hypothetical protein
MKILYFMISPFSTIIEKYFFFILRITIAGSCLNVALQASIDIGRCLKNKTIFLLSGCMLRDIKSATTIHWTPSRSPATELTLHYYI